jgi:hypothetical protein
MPLSKAEQIAEGQRRVDQGIVPRDTNPSNETIDQSPETTGPEDTGTEAVQFDQPQDRQAQKPNRIDPRQAIYDRFRADRVTNEAAEDVAELRAFANQGAPPEMLEQPQAEQQQPEQQSRQQQPEQQDQDKPLVISRMLKVRGQEIDPSTLSEQQLIGALQKGLAGDDYLNEARSKADEATAALQRVNTLMQQTEQRVRGPAAEHPGSETTGTPAPGQTDAIGEHPAEAAVDPWVDAVKQIAFEEPEKAAKTLQTIVEGIVAKGAKQGAKEQLYEDRKSDELARNKRMLEDFKTKHPDIASDPRAVAAVKTDVATMQYADLLALGFAETALPKVTDTQELARWHLHYRTEGAKVRPIGDLMEKAVTDFRTWKGSPAETPPESQPVAKPRVVVKLDRTERRETIPQQPNRSVSPRPDAGQPQQRDRSDVVAQMARTRAAPRGRVVA